MLCPSMIVVGQKEQGYWIGSKVPDAKITNIVNGQLKSTRFSAYKGKLLILDFMNTACGPCVKILPLLDSLQKKYSQRLQILMVTGEDQQRVTEYLRTRRIHNIPFATSDTSLTKLFPHQYISHIVWIDGDGIVRGLTHSEYINVKNIETLLKGDKVNWPIKNESFNYDFSQRILKINDSNISTEDAADNVSYTAISKYLPNAQKYFKVTTDSSKRLVHTIYTNYSIVDLYILLHNLQFWNFPNTRVLLEMSDKSRFIINRSETYFDVWQKENYYCMEAVMSQSIPIERQRKKMISDLNFYLNLNGRVEKRNVECWIIRNKYSLSDTLKIPITGGLRMGKLMSLLNKQIGQNPVIDETFGSSLITLPILVEDVVLNDHLRFILDQNGFELVKELREMDMLVFSDNNLKK